MRDLETTARIRREDLTDLLELERAPSKQRITAEMPAVTLTNLLCIDDEVAMPTLAGSKHARTRGTDRDSDAMMEMPSVVVRFRDSAQQQAVASAWPLDRWPQVNRGFVIAISASATLVLAHLLSLL